MTDGVYGEIDASSIYSQGQAFQIVAKPLNVFGIVLKNNGTVPEELSQSYSSPNHARIAINTYMALRKEHFDKVERRKKVKKEVKRLNPEPEAAAEG